MVWTILGCILFGLLIGGGFGFAMGIYTCLKKEAK